MLFDWKYEPDEYPDPPDNCRCFQLYGNAIFEEESLCYHCGGWMPPLGISPADLKELIIWCAQTETITEADATDMIYFYGLKYQ